VGVVHQPVEDDLANCRVTDPLVPVIDGELAGHEGGAAADVRHSASS
jgi:hypothetical protein